MKIGLIDVDRSGFPNLASVDGFARSKITVYILVNFDTTISEDLHRISFVKSCGFQPYTMIYNKHLLPKNSFYFQLQNLRGQIS